MTFPNIIIDGYEFKVLHNSTDFKDQYIYYENRSLGANISITILGNYLYFINFLMAPLFIEYFDAQQGNANDAIRSLSNYRFKKKLFAAIYQRNYDKDI